MLLVIFWARLERCFGDRNLIEVTSPLLLWELYLLLWKVFCQCRSTSHELLSHKWIFSHLVFMCFPPFKVVLLPSIRTSLGRCPCSSLSQLHPTLRHSQHSHVAFPVSEAKTNTIILFNGTFYLRYREGEQAHPSYHQQVSPSLGVITADIIVS